MQNVPVRLRPFPGPRPAPESTLSSVRYTSPSPPFRPPENVSRPDRLPPPPPPPFRPSLAVTPPNLRDLGVLGPPLPFPFLLPAELLEPAILAARSGGNPSAPHPKSASPAVESFGGRSAAAAIIFHGGDLFLSAGSPPLFLEAAAAPNAPPATCPCCCCCCCCRCRTPRASATSLARASIPGNGGCGGEDGTANVNDNDESAGGALADSCRTELEPNSPPAASCGIGGDITAPPVPDAVAAGSPGNSPPRTPRSLIESRMRRPARLPRRSAVQNPIDAVGVASPPPSLDHFRGEGAVASVPPPTEDPSPSLVGTASSSPTPPPPGVTPAVGTPAKADTEEDPRPPPPPPAAPAAPAAAAAAIAAATATASPDPTDVDFIIAAAEFLSKDCGRLIAAVSAEDDIESRPSDAADNNLDEPGVAPARAPAPAPAPVPTPPAAASSAIAAPVPANFGASLWWVRPSPWIALSFAFASELTPLLSLSFASPPPPVVSIFFAHAPSPPAISVSADLIAAAPSPFAMDSTM